MKTPASQTLLRIGLALGLFVTFGLYSLATGETTAVTLSMLAASGVGLVATYRAPGNTIDHTPGSAVTAGDVIVIGSRLVAIATADIAANALGNVATRGLFDVVKDNSNVTNGDPAYWDDDGDPVGGSAGTGAFSGDATKGPFAGWFLETAGTTVGTCLLLLRSMDDLPFEGTISGNLAVTGTGTITSTSASALTVGRQGGTAPAFKVNANAATCVTGVEVVARANGAGASLVAIGSGTNEKLTIDAKGTGDLELNQTATGAVVVKKLKQVAQTVTADDAEGAGNTILPGVTSVVMDAVTNNADDFIVLPALADVPDGHAIRIYGEADSNFEVRTPASSTELINGQDCDGTKEYLFTKLQVHTFIKQNATVGWVAHGITALGAAVTPVVPD